jgi:hypothetical protein
MTHVIWDLKLEEIDAKEISKLIDFIERSEPKSSLEYDIKRRLLHKIYEQIRSLEDFEFVQVE